MLEVIDGKVSHDGIEYIVGEVIEDLSEVDEQRLVDLKVCRRVELYQEEADDQVEAGDHDDANDENKEVKNSDDAAITDDADGTKAKINLDINPDDLIKGTAKRGSKK